MLGGDLADHQTFSGLGLDPLIYILPQYHARFRFNIALRATGPIALCVRMRECIILILL